MRKKKVKFFKIGLMLRADVGVHAETIEAAKDVIRRDFPNSLARVASAEDGSHLYFEIDTVEFTEK